MKPNKYQNIRAFSRRNKILKDAGYEDYQDFLKGPVWKKIKEKVARKVKKGDTYWDRCCICGCIGGVDLHHQKYKRGMLRPILANIRPLCREHHDKVHKIARLGYSFKVAESRVRSDMNRLLSRLRKQNRLAV